MRSKIIVNGKGEPQAARTEIRLEGSGGELGIKAVTDLVKLINRLKDMENEQDILVHYGIISGFAVCCESCGFITKKNTDDVMRMVEHLVKNELVRIEAKKHK